MGIALEVETTSSRDVGAGSLPVHGPYETASEMAERLHVSRRSVLRWAAAGAIPCLRSPGGRTVRFDPVAVEAALKRGRP